jgi:hypothetical protein
MPNRRASAALLWGQNLLAGPASAEQKYAPLPPTVSPDPEPTGKLICLSCHDGNYAPAAMMKNEIYETVPESYGSFHHVPTLTDKPSVTTGNDISDHPVGLDARLSCGGTRGWDCTESQDGTITMGGRHSSGFAGHYGYFVRPRNYDKTSIVVCTTCHNPHLVNVVHVPRNSESALFPAGTYATRYFLRAPYNPNAAPDGGNQAAQFCRQCHADKSNEMNGSPYPLGN